ADGSTGTTTIMSPAGTQVGDLLLAHVVDDGPTDEATVPTPAGWTRVVAGHANQDQFVVVVFYRFAAATSETFTFTFTDASFAGLNYIELMAFSGVSQTAPVNASNINALTDASQPTAPSVTTTKANTMLVTMYAMDLSADTFQTVTGMTEIYDQATGQLQIAADRAIVAATGATGTKVATRSGTDIGPTINATVALAP
ncbi:MAG TPA: hypothetical protein VL326_34915, partial [Kofleriaceae bacterium]|nr:hypothetical protein [Kofleriaceae bacterium]